MYDVTIHTASSIRPEHHHCIARHPRRSEKQASVGAFTDFVRAAPSPVVVVVVSRCTVLRAATPAPATTAAAATTFRCMGVGVGDLKGLNNDAVGKLVLVGGRVGQEVGQVGEEKGIVRERKERRERGYDHRRQFIQCIPPITWSAWHVLKHETTFTCTDEVVQQGLKFKIDSS